MKKGLKIAGIVLGSLVLLIILLPFLFKDKIKAKIDSEIAKNINAKVYYNDIGLSLFSNFPNFTLSMDKFGMVGKAEAFAGDTLMNVEEFSVSLDIMSVISGDKIKVNSIYLKKPYILTRYTKEGAFSWDITYPDTTAQVDTAAGEPAKFAVNITKWAIEDATIIYDDPTMPVYARLNHFDHKGSGDITEAIYDISTYTKSPEVHVEFDGVTYLNKYLVEIKADMNINMDSSKYTFKDNEFTINNFKLGFDGFLAMPDSNITMDIKYGAKETSFKNLISLVPAVFLKGYEDLKTEGTLAFDGYAKGTYNSVTMPSFGLKLLVDKAMMQYPELPTAMKNIAIDLNVECKDGVIDHTIIDLKKFNVDLGNNPIKADAYVNGLNPYDIQKCNLNAQVKLEEVTKMFPVDSVTMKGLFGITVSVKGKYSDELKLMPVVSAKAKLSDGYIKYEGFAEALDKVNMSAVVSSDGNMSTSTANLEYLKLELDKEPFELAAKVINFDDPNYDANFKGKIDLAKMTKLFPLEGTTLAGVIVANVQTKGVMSDVTEGRYGKTSTGGTMDITNLNYVSATDLPQGFGLSTANFVFSPEKIQIVKMVGNAGKSDIDVTGYFSNYMGYLFGGKDTTIHGRMTFASKKFNVNEWMTDDSTAAPEEAPAEPETALEIPKNIDFVLTSTIGKVIYDNMNMTNLAGDIIVKDGMVRMKDLKFGMLGGDIGMNGMYSSVDIKKPVFDFDMDMKNIVIKEAYKTFNTVQKLAPVAETIEGTFSTTLKLKGPLGQDMLPINEKLSGAGEASIASVTIKDNKVLGGLASLTKSKDLNPLTIRDTKIKYKIDDGKLIVAPFDIKAGETKINLGGSTGFDGNMDYLAKLELPSGAAGTAANNAIGDLTGQKNVVGKTVKMNVRIVGPMSSPKFKPEGGGTGSDLKEQAKEQISNEINNAKEEAEKKAKEEADRLKKEAEEQAKAELEKQKKKAEKKAKAEAERLKKEQEEKLKKEAEKQLKDKIKF